MLGAVPKSRLISADHHGEQQEACTMRKEMSLGVLALVLAFVAVQGATLLQGTPAPTVAKGEFAVDETAQLLTSAAQPAPVSQMHTMVPIFLGPLLIAVVCYLVVKRTIA